MREAAPRVQRHVRSSAACLFRPRSQNPRGPTRRSKTTVSGRWSTPASPADTGNAQRHSAAQQQSAAPRRADDAAGKRRQHAIAQRVGADQATEKRFGRSQCQRPTGFRRQCRHQHRCQHCGGPAVRARNPAHSKAGAAKTNRKAVFRHDLRDRSDRLGAAGRTVRDDARSGRRCDPGRHPHRPMPRLQRRHRQRHGAACHCRGGHRGQHSGRRPQAGPSAQTQDRFRRRRRGCDRIGGRDCNQDGIAQAAAGAQQRGIAAPVKQPATQTDTTAAPEAALTAAVAATAPVAPKDHAAQGSGRQRRRRPRHRSPTDTNSATSDPSATATPASASQTNVAQQPAAAAKPEAGNEGVDAPKADAAANASPASAAAPSAHDQSPVTATDHTPTDLSGYRLPGDRHDPAAAPCSGGHGRSRGPPERYARQPMRRCR